MRKQDSKELSPRPLANAPKTFTSKKPLQCSKAHQVFNANDAPKTSISVSTDYGHPMKA